MNSKFQKPEESPGFLLWQVTCAWQRQQREALRPLGLTHPQFVILAALLWLATHTTDPITQTTITQFTKIDKMSLSDLVKTLEKKDWLQREPHSKDRRAHSLVLTEEGRRVVLRATPLVESVDKAFFAKRSQELCILTAFLTPPKLMKCLR